MKIVKLAGPALVNGAVRYPVEGALTVTDTEAERLSNNNLLDGEPEDVPESDEPSEPKKAARGAAKEQ